MYKLYTFFDGCDASVLPLQHFTFVLNQIVVTTMKRMLNKMLRYVDAIVKRGVDKLIDAIGHSPEPQTKSAETPQQKSMGNDTDCAPQTTDSTTDCGLTEQAISLMDELCDIRYNVLDRTSEVQRRDQADKGEVHCRGSGAWAGAAASAAPTQQQGCIVCVRRKHDEGVLNILYTPFNGAESDDVRILWCSMRFAANAENIRTKGHKDKRYNVCVSRLARKT